MSELREKIVEAIVNVDSPLNAFVVDGEKFYVLLNAFIAQREALEETLHYSCDTPNQHNGDIVRAIADMNERLRKLGVEV